MAAGGDPRHPFGIPDSNGNSVVAGVATRLGACEEEALVMRARSGDREAFEQLYRRHVHAVAGFVARRVSRAEVDDVVADTFVAAWRAIDRYEWRGVSMRAWLVTIAGRQIIARSRRRAATEVVASDLEPLLDPATADVAVDRMTDRIDLQRALAALSPDQRLAVDLRYLADLSAEDAGALLGVSAGAVRARTHRALASLRRTLIDPAGHPA